MKKTDAIAVSSKTLGDGPVRIRLLSGTADAAVMEMGVDYTKAEVPERAYYADYDAVAKDRLGYSLTFGKLVPGTSRLRTKIEVTFPEEMFVRQLWGNSRAFHDLVRTASEKIRLEAVAEVQETDKVQTFRANNVFMGMWGEDSLLDFYYISPKDIHGLMSKTKLNIGLEPVVRVVMGTALMNEFLDKCRSFVGEAGEVREEEQL